MNTSVRAAYEDMRAWDPADDGPGIPWPDDWVVDPEAFRCGIDFSLMDDKNEIRRLDLEKIEAWHTRCKVQFRGTFRFSRSITR